jgi:hypothetical protein
MLLLSGDVPEGAIEPRSGWLKRLVSDFNAA